MTKMGENKNTNGRRFIDPRVLQKIDAQGQEGLFLRDLPSTCTLEVDTKNTTYRFIKDDDKFTVSGHERFCPGPTPVSIAGSTFGGSIIKPEFVGIGMHLELFLDRRTIVTSKISALRIVSHIEKPRKKRELKRNLKLKKAKTAPNPPDRIHF